MHIEKDIVVSIHYKLFDDQQQEIENSYNDDIPMQYLHGHNNLIIGLEKELEGKQPGDRLSVTVSPEEGYGAYEEAMKQQLPSSDFEGLNPEVGMGFTAETDSGPMPVTVTEVTEETVTVDGNHPFAGKTIRFEVEVTEIRDATPTELEHGHLHSGECCGGDHDHEH
ncbi:MAG: peptidylprolyl isomerase [Gammaproteobacteria bacterium]|nr:peptidylprolyl isomerase [Gammaproteobacteria bacterium]